MQMPMPCWRVPAYWRTATRFTVANTHAIEIAHLSRVHRCKCPCSVGSLLHASTQPHTADAHALNLHIATRLRSCSCSRIELASLPSRLPLQVFMPCRRSPFQGRCCMAKCTLKATYQECGHPASPLQMPLLLQGLLLLSRPRDPQAQAGRLLLSRPRAPQAQAGRLLMCRPRDPQAHAGRLLLARPRAPQAKARRLLLSQSRDPQARAHPCH